MKLVAIVVGHGPIQDRGAVNRTYGTTELDWNRDLAKRIRLAIGERVPSVIVNRQIENVPPVAQVNHLGATLAVELHLNAYNERASGTEMLFWHTSKRGKALAEALQKAAVGVLQLPDRGVKYKVAGDRGAGFLSKTNPPAVIVESFFIDNPGDLQRGNSQKDALAAAYADVLVEFA